MIEVKKMPYLSILRNKTPKENVIEIMLEFKIFSDWLLGSLFHSTF